MQKQTEESFSRPAVFQEFVADNTVHRNSGEGVLTLGTERSGWSIMQQKIRNVFWSLNYSVFYEATAVF